MVPLFVPCLLVGMVVGNLLALFPPPAAGQPTPRRCRCCRSSRLGVFLAISLMALQLWALAGMAGHADRWCSRRRPRWRSASRCFARLPLARPGLPGGGAVGGLRELRGRRHPDRHRHDDRGDQALRPLPGRLHRAAAGLGALRRHRQRPRHPGLPRALGALSGDQELPTREPRPRLAFAVRSTASLACPRQAPPDVFGPNGRCRTGAPAQAGAHAVPRFTRRKAPRCRPPGLRAPCPTSFSSSFPRKSPPGCRRRRGRRPEPPRHRRPRRARPHLCPRRRLRDAAPPDARRRGPGRGARPRLREERKGPRADAPAAAVDGFLRATGLTRDQLEIRDACFCARDRAAIAPVSAL